MEDNGIHDSAHRAPRGRNTNSKSAVAGEVAWYHRDAGDKQGTGSYADTDALSEYELPVFFAKTRHHHSEDDQERPREDHGLHEAHVEEWAGEHAHEA